MDSKGRAIDNVFCERLWWSVKYEKVYLQEFEDGTQIVEWHSNEYFQFYNQMRPHQGLNYQTPAKIHGVLAN